MKKIISVLLSLMISICFAIPANAASDSNMTYASYSLNNTSYITIKKTPVFLAADTSLSEPSGYINEKTIILPNRIGSTGFANYVFFTDGNGTEYKVLEHYLYCTTRNYTIKDYEKNIISEAEKIMTAITTYKAGSIDCSSYSSSTLKGIEQYINLKYFNSIDYFYASYKRPGLVLDKGIVDIEKSRINYYKATQCVKDILTSLNLSGKSDVEKIYAIEDYIANLITYDFKSDSIHGYGTIECLYANKGICGDYAATFQLLCQEAGIKSIVVLGRASSDSTINHAWNRVYINGKWVAVDVCFFDNSTDKDKYRLFNDSDRIISSVLCNI